MIGLRPHHFPSKEEDIFIFQYLRKKYGNRTIDELYLAFDLAINNKLDIDEVKVYDQFSIEYLVRIFNAYIRYAREEIIHNPLPKQIESNSRMITEEEKIADIEEYLNADNVPKVAPLYLYDWMEELGYIKFSNKEKYDWYQKAIQHMLNRLRNQYEMNPTNRIAMAEYKNFKQRIDDDFKDLTPQEEVTITNEYKRLVLYHKFKTHKQ